MYQYFIILLFLHNAFKYSENKSLTLFGHSNKICLEEKKLQPADPLKIYLPPGVYRLTRYREMLRSLEVMQCLL